MSPSNPARRPAPLDVTRAAVAALAFALGGTLHAADTENAATGVPAGVASESGAAPSDGTAVAGASECAPGDDYPTTAVADYVLGCMAANGNTHDALQQCSCSIDFIKSRMDYASYEEVSTILQVQRDIGQRGVYYRDSNWAKGRVERLEALQAESTLRCF